MICSECEKGMVRLQLSHGVWSEEGLFPKSLSGFQTVPCPTCNGTGKVYDYDDDDYDSQDLINPIRFDRSGTG